MGGILTGIGVGPGDPELMTLKAVRLIRECDIVVVPGNGPSESIAFQIASGAVPELGEKAIVCVDMPMTKDPQVLEQSHTRAAEKIAALLEEGKHVCMLTLGDPTIYSTYIYVHQKVGAMGYDTQIVSGIPSICAAAARLNIGLVEKAESLHVIPATYPVDEALQLHGTKVLMKAGRNLAAVKKKLLERTDDVLFIERCGMEGERVVSGAEHIPEDASYYSLTIVKDGPER